MDKRLNTTNILNASLKMTLTVFLIKLLGFVKQMILAWVYGTAYQMDAYFIATNVLNAIGTIIFSSISVSLLTMYTEKRLCAQKEAADFLVSDVIKCLVPMAVLLSLAFFLAAPVVAKMLAPRFEGEQIAVLSKYIQIMAPSFVFVCYHLIVNTILESNKRFLPGKGLHLLQNLFAILIALLFSNTGEIHYLVASFLLAGIVQCVLLTICAKKYFTFRWKFHSESKEPIRSLLYLSLPLWMGNAVYEINDIVDKQIASGLFEGGVSVLTYGASLNEIVSTVIIGSASTVLFSYFASWAAMDDKQKIERSLKTSSETFIALLVPVSIICILCAEEMVTLLYGRGSFSPEAITQTSSVFMGYAMGFVFQALRSNFSKVFYAYKDTRVPMISGVISVAANIVLSLLLSRILGSQGIAMATSAAMCLSTIILYCQLKKHLPELKLRLGKETLKALLSGCVMGLVLYTVHQSIRLPLPASLLIEVLAAALTYLFLMRLLKSNALMALKDFLHHRKIASLTNRGGDENA